MINNIYTLVKKYNLCSKTSSEKWLAIIDYMLDKGWLYYISDENIVLGAYRIKEYTDKTEDSLPIEEEGNILYVPFVCSESKDRFIFLKMLKNYLKSNDIKEIIFNEHNKHNRLHRIKICNKQNP